MRKARKEKHPLLHVQKILVQCRAWSHSVSHVGNLPVWWFLWWVWCYVAFLHKGSFWVTQVPSSSWAKSKTRCLRLSGICCWCCPFCQSSSWSCPCVQSVVGHGVCSGSVTLGFRGQGTAELAPFPLAALEVMPWLWEIDGFVCHGDTSGHYEPHPFL